MSIQYEPTSDPDWEHLRAVLAQSRTEAAPIRRSYWRIIEAIALIIVTIGFAVLVKVEVADTPGDSVALAIEQFEAQVTRIEQEAVAALRARVVEAQPATPKPAPRVNKPKKTSMLEPDAQADGNHIVAQSMNEAPKFQVEIVDRNHRRVVSADDKRMVIEIAQPRAISAAGNKPLPVHLEPVILRARINKNGTVENLTKLSGPTELTTAAIETVAALHYQPSSHNADSDTEITVNFVPAR